MVEHLDYINYFTNKNYCTIFYLIVNKNFTYKNELNKIKKLCWEHYFEELLADKIITIYDLLEDEEEFLLSKKGFGRYHLENGRFYKFTSLGINLLSQPLLKDLYYKHISKETIRATNNYKLLKEAFENE